MGLEQFGQDDDGKTMDLPLGIRQIQTLKKLPKINPKVKIEIPIIINSLLGE